MNFIRNFKLYIKSKSTIMALCFLFFFFITYILSFISLLYERKGIYDEFKQYDVDMITTNNNNVVYVTCKNKLFYSQNKLHKSTLNDFVGIKDYSNQYGQMKPKIYNFIQINYEFSSDIIDVQAISDNALGEKGETYILTSNNDLYMISSRNSNVELIMKDVKKM